MNSLNFGMINPSVFREYDIRGTVGVELSEDFAWRLGGAYAQLILRNSPRESRDRHTVAVGEDCRLSSSPYGKALIAGLIDSGINVIHIGNCPTPALYFSLFHFNLDGGLMVTASHLPSDKNGFKICVGQHTIFGETIQTLKALMSEPRRTRPPAECGIVTGYDILPTYFGELLQRFRRGFRDILPQMKRKKIVLDCGNGNGSQVAPQVLRDLGAEVVELHCELNGLFPNHLPDPSDVRNLSALTAKVREVKADFGIALDGDADRIGIVDEQGKVVFGDELLMIYSREILHSHPGCTVVSDVKASDRLFEDVTRHGGHAVMCKTGHSLIEEKMRLSGALLGGEMSGHMFFADHYFGFDDAIYAAMRIYQIASCHSGHFSTLLRGLPASFVTPEIRLACLENEKFELVAKAIALLKDQEQSDGVKMTLIDGIRIDFGDGWGLLRASNTEPVISLRFEAKTQERVRSIQKLFLDAIALAKAQCLENDDGSPLDQGQ